MSLAWLIYRAQRYHVYPFSIQWMALIVGKGILNIHIHINIIFFWIPGYVHIDFVQKIPADDKTKWQNPYFTKYLF